MPMYLVIAYIIFVAVPLGYAASLLLRKQRLERVAADLERELHANPS